MKLKRKQQKHLMLGAVVILFLFGFALFIYPHLSGNSLAILPTSTPTPTPAYNPYPTFNPYPTINTVPTLSPTIAPQPTIEPTWINVNVEPSAISYQGTAYVTITADAGDVWVNLYIESVSSQHAWANMVVPVWVDSSTNTGTYEMQKTTDGYYFPPEAQYNIHAEWDDESSNQDSVWISLT